MSKKFWTLRPTGFFTKPNPNGHRNEIVWAAIGKQLLMLGCAAYFWLRTRNWATSEPGVKT